MSLLYPEASDFYTQRWCTPRPRKQKDQMVDFIRLCKIMRKFFDDSGNYNPPKKLFKAQCYPAKQFVPGTRMRLQMSTFYCNYGNTIHSHKEFLRRYMPQKNKEAVAEKPVLFGNISTEEYEKKIVWRHYKFMLSPETKMDRNSLEEYAKKIMEKFELYHRIKVDWQAVVHTNTEHPHVHILINGVDQNGKPFWVKPDFIRMDGREMSNEILTWMNGPRTEEQVAAYKSRMANANRWTILDEQLKDHLSGNSVTFAELSPELQKRAEHLRDLGIAEYRDGSMTFEQEWKSTLRSLGRYNTFLDARAHVSVGSKVVQYTPDMGEIQGVCRKVYIMDDESVWKNAIVIEDTTSRTAYFVPLYSPDRQTKVGEKVKISASKNQKGRLSVKVTRQNGGQKARKDRNYGGREF